MADNLQAKGRVQKPQEENFGQKHIHGSYDIKEGLLRQRIFMENVLLRLRHILMLSSANLWQN